MIADFIITFREALELALIIGIILGYLTKTKQEKYNNIVFVGLAAGIIFSLIGAVLFSFIAGGFAENEALFEGITMLIGSVLLTSMILWMIKQKNIAGEIKEKVSVEISEAKKFGLFFLVFVLVLREGIETVIFLNASFFASGSSNLIGAFAGIIGAVFLGYLLFVSSKKINIKKFFGITGILLILFAAGLTSHGIHELQEAGVVPVIINEVWNINPALNADGSFPLLHEKGLIGSIAKGLFGYNGNPSLIEVLSYLVYLVIVVVLWKKQNEKNLK